MREGTCEMREGGGCPFVVELVKVSGSGDGDGNGVMGKEVPWGPDDVGRGRGRGRRRRSSEKERGCALM